MLSCSQRIQARNFQRIARSEFFWGWASPYAASTLFVALPAGHSDMSRFCPWPPFTTGIHLDRAQLFPNIAQTTGTLTFLIRVQTFREPHRRQIPHIQIFMNDGINPLT